MKNCIILYWIDYDECEVVAKEIDSRIERKIFYSDATKRIIETYKNSLDKTLITIHFHPTISSPRLSSSGLSKVNVNMFGAINNSVMNDGCGLFRGRLILPYYYQLALYYDFCTHLV